MKIKVTTWKSLGRFLDRFDIKDFEISKISFNEDKLESIEFEELKKWKKK